MEAPRCAEVTVGQTLDAELVVMEVHDRNTWDVTDPLPVLIICRSNEAVVLVARVDNAAVRVVSLALALRPARSSPA